MDASKFASFWELDENDIDEPSMDEIQSVNPMNRHSLCEHSNAHHIILNVFVFRIASVESAVGCRERQS